MTYKIIDLKTGFLLVNNFIRNNNCYIEQSYYSKDKPNFTKQIHFNDREYTPKVFKYVDCEFDDNMIFNNGIQNITTKEFELKYDYTLVDIIDLNNSNNTPEALSDFNYKDFLVKLSHYYVL